MVEVNQIPCLPSHSTSHSCLSQNSFIDRHLADSLSTDSDVGLTRWEAEPSIEGVQPTDACILNLPGLSRDDL